jgi:hypothetical protein
MDFLKGRIMFIPSIARRSFPVPALNAPDIASRFTRLFRSFLAPITCCVLLCCIAGCPKPGSTPTNNQSGSKASSLGEASGKGKTTPAARKGQSEFPPLKIGLVDCESLETDLLNRWQSVSDQPLEFIKIDRKSIFESPVGAIDVLIYPGNLIGSLTQADWIAPIPKPLLERITRIGQTKGNSIDGQTGLGADGETQAWPARWRAISKIGNKTMGIPLGAPSWVAAMRGLETQPLVQLHRALVSNQNTSEVSSENWDDFITLAESKLGDQLASNRETLQSLLKDRTNIDRRAVVSRYLWIMSTTESRYRGLFDLYKMVSRLNLPEFSRNARLLARLSAIEPTTALLSPTDAWERVATGQAIFGIGWPRTDGIQRADEANHSGELILSPMIWNGADGLLASLGRKTRQSANASDWIEWFTTEESRIAMQQHSSVVELLELDNDRNRVREDYREYQSLQRMEASSVSLEMTPRFHHADELLNLLADALLDVLADPNSAEERLMRCKQEWDKELGRFGKDRIRVSVESTVGLSE